MGGFQSKENTLPENNIFEKDLKDINNVVDNLINSKNLFKNDEYNFFLKSKCKELVVVNQHKLAKYKKYQLDYVGDNYFLIPKEELNKTKKEYCHNISMYFTRILKLIFCIKYVYDLENNGDRSIGGIIMRNIKMNDDLLKVSFCESKQNDLRDFQKGVNFSMLSGFDMFIKYILTQEEANVFVKQLEVILDTYDKKRLKKYVCKDLIVDEKTHSRIHRSTFTCHQKGGSSKRFKDNEDIFIKVGEDNPIFSWNLCAFSKTHIAKNYKQLNSLIVEMKANYKFNFKKVLELLHEIVYLDPVDNTHKLSGVTHQDLDNIEKRLKRTIIIFFMQSLSDYKNVLNTIKHYSINTNE
uniref:Uncharacterized protein n=1 Tax=Pyramimonas orientalis virus TaxID=455367 RepID=A0A7M3UNU4_POV01|nr:hypothetical protein HWQ62_00244 [Pyramimonas orientalis virus]